MFSIYNGKRLDELYFITVRYCFKDIHDITDAIMEENDAVVDLLEEKIKKIYKRKKGNQKSKEGDIGEEFAILGIKQCGFNKGYKIRKKGNGTFRIYKQVSAIKGRGGVDIFVEFTDNYGKTSGFLVEAKNWKYYPKGISNSFYEDEIQDRFVKPDSNNEFPHSVTMNKKNIPSIIERCNRNGITPLPIDDKITKKNMDADSLKPILEHFVDDFSDYIKNDIPDLNMEENVSFKDDLLQGKDYKVIAKKYDKSVGYIRNIGAKLDMPNRRDKEWRDIYFMRFREV